MGGVCGGGVSGDSSCMDTVLPGAQTHNAVCSPTLLQHMGVVFLRLAWLRKLRDATGKHTVAQWQRHPQRAFRPSCCSK